MINRSLYTYLLTKTCPAKGQSAILEGDINGNGVFDPGETDPSNLNTHNISCPSDNDDSEYRAYYYELSLAGDVGTFNTCDWSSGNYGKQWRK